MDFPTPDHNSFIIIPHTFAATRVYEEEGETHVSSTTITLSISCAPLDDGKLSAEEVGTKAIIGFQRLKVWLEGILDYVILIDKDSDLLEVMQDQTANHTMVTPGKPDDALLSALLHCKATSITEGLLEIFTLSLKATDTNDIERRYRCPDQQYPLPGIEYFGKEAAHDIPWWYRPTIDVCDFEKSDDEETIAFYSADPLADIGRDYLTNDAEADIIVFDAWKKDK
jgi:hypothetical protein